MLDAMRRKASAKFALLQTADEDLSRQAITAFIELWEAQRKARFDLFKLKAPEAEFPIDWEQRLAKAETPAERNKAATSIIKKLVTDGHANLHPEMTKPEDL